MTATRWAMKKRRYLGTSHLFNVQSNSDFKNGLDIRIDEESVSVEISSLIEPDRRVQLAGTADEAKAYRRLLVAMERESLRARRQAGEFAFFKNRTRRKPAKPAVCELCGGYGGNTDEDGNWHDCPRCRG